MRIGIVGTGSVGGALGTAWAKKGHSVVFGTRDPGGAEVKTLVAGASGSRAARVAEAVAATDVVVLAVPYEAAADVLKGAGDLAGKVLVDATNPLADRAQRLSLPNTTSGAEEIAKAAPGATVVKAFNTIGFNVMADPSFPGGAATLLLCGDDAAAKKTVAGLASDLGFDPVDAGPLSESRLLEPFALLWIHLALFRGQGREIAFRLLKR